MTKLIILGSSDAIPSLDHENTHLALVSATGFTMIDCPGNPVIRLSQAGLDPLNLDHLVITHFHPDHVSGAPSLIMQSWLMGRKRPLEIYGLAYTLTRLKRNLALYGWDSWPDLFPVHFHTILEKEFLPFLETSDFRLIASPVKHIVPAVGLRMEFFGNHHIVAFSSDTEPCQSVVQLAKDANLLIHEAAGASHGHSSARQAALIATQAKAKKLALIHYATWNKPVSDSLLEEAEEVFPGEVFLAKDFMEFILD